FEIPYFTVSGIQVRYLKIVEKSGYQALPWVRYITQNGDDYSLRTALEKGSAPIVPILARGPASSTSPTRPSPSSASSASPVSLHSGRFKLLSSFTEVRQVVADDFWQKQRQDWWGHGRHTRTRSAEIRREPRPERTSRRRGATTTEATTTANTAHPPPSATVNRPLSPPVRFDLWLWQQA
ncbi:hypothetical protein GY45DRAFT_1376062, partial [Cubamyces sp. BRFM 1775]